MSAIKVKINFCDQSSSSWNDEFQRWEVIGFDELLQGETNHNQGQKYTKEQFDDAGYLYYYTYESNEMLENNVEITDENGNIEIY